VYIRLATNGIQMDKLLSPSEWIIRRGLSPTTEKEAGCSQASPPCCSSSLLSFLTATARNLDAFFGLIPSS
jgi:hypothetical protein